MTFWADKVVAITGAGSGIGAALAAALARRGARLRLTDIDGDAVSAVAKKIGGGAKASTLDVTDRESFRAHIAHIAKTDGRIDALFNNAGVVVAGDMRELSGADFDRAVDVNIRGVVNGVLAAYPLMVSQGGGAIINTASAAGLMGVAFLAPYAMSKHAVVGLTRSLRAEAAFHNVSVCALCPTAVDTPLLETAPPSALKTVWRPDLRAYLTRLGGPPFNADKFAAYSLKQIEKNKAIIVAPMGARLRLKLAHWAPPLAAYVANRAMRKALADQAPASSVEISAPKPR